MNSREARELIEELEHAYVQCIDDNRLEDWPDFFSDDCLYKIISRENFDRGLSAPVMYCDSKGMLQDRVTAHRHANVYEPHYYRHLISNVRLLGETDGRFRVQANYAVFQTKLDGDTRVYNVGRYLDTVVMENGRARFKEKLVVFDTLRVPTLLVTPI